MKKYILSFFCLCLYIVSFAQRQEITLFEPHTWNTTDVYDDIPGYLRCEKEYTTLFEVVDTTLAYTLCFDGVGQQAQVFVNHHRVGEHVGGYTRFYFDVSPYIHKGSNLVLVKVSNAFNPDVPPLTADFNFYGGIYRRAYLLISSPVHIVPDGVCITTPVVTDARAQVNCHVNWVNPNRQKVKLRYMVIDPDGKKISSCCNKLNETQFIIKNPRLWSPSAPQLYTLLIQVVNTKGQVLDEETTRFGLRYYHFDPNEGFFLNGKHLKLIGTNRHQDEMGYGNALQPWQHERDIQMIKDMGANFLRVSHYPQDKRVMEMCDSLGILCSVEIPVVDYITESKEFFQNCLDMLDEMIAQNRNHPSVIIWAYINEILMQPPYKLHTPQDSAYIQSVAALARALDNRCRQLDPERYTMMAFQEDWERNYSAGLITIPQIVGINLYDGWYHGIFSMFDEQLDFLHQHLPDKVIMVTEYGADNDIRIRSLHPLRFDQSTDYALLFHQHYYNAIMTRPFIAGAAAWNFNDFQSERRSGPSPHFNLKGLVSTKRVKKPTYFYYQSILSPDSIIRQSAKDSLKKVCQLSVSLSDTMRLLLGSNRFFWDTTILAWWIPEKEKQYVAYPFTCYGGAPFAVKSNPGFYPAIDREIKESEQDPIYQTARVGLDSIVFDVPNGTYQIDVYWSEIQRHWDKMVDENGQISAQYSELSIPREMNIYINDSLWIPNLQVYHRANTSFAIHYSIGIIVKNQHITIHLEAIKGQTLINAIKITPIIINTLK